MLCNCIQYNNFKFLKPQNSSKHFRTYNVLKVVSKRTLALNKGTILVALVIPLKGLRRWIFLNKIFESPHECIHSQK